MFDKIRCEQPLPDGWQPAEPMQTKDFDCELVEYVITADGRLLCDRGQPKELPTEYLEYPAAFSHFNEIADSRSDREAKMMDTGFDGTVHFGGWEVIGYESSNIDARHTTLGPRGKPIYKTHDYRAKFVGGRLVEIAMGEH